MDYMEEAEKNEKWYLNEEIEEYDYSFKEYEVTSTPNDFNTKTIIDFIESGLFKIPDFQRNYIWDIKRASKLVESLIIGLPIPQVFLYEESKNKYLVIDGQQRLLTVYFFSKMRFPKKEKRFELRQIFVEYGLFPDEYLHNDEYFDDFKLKLHEPSSNEKNKLHGLNYGTLGDLKSSFDLRTIRNIMIKQNIPSDDDSSMFEIFNRLNSGGVVLKPQEIRASLYHSKFYNQLYKLNINDNWRALLNKKEPDIHMKDVEILLRGFAMLVEGDNYSPSMTRFLNLFSKKTRSYTDESLEYFKQIFELFCSKSLEYNPSIFLAKTGKFSFTIFESIFVGLCNDAVKSKSLKIKETTNGKIEKLKATQDFISATTDNTAGSKNVLRRLSLAKEIL
jgi:uncharacterized protein with ParB-like and HNH nuclease domain